MNALTEASGNQQRVGVALGAALSEGPSHAYLLRGPTGSGKSRIARAFAAEILASDSTDPEETRRRALQDPSPHPDLVWLQPKGMSHAVADVRERLIKAAPLTPFEGAHRVFVVEAADVLGEESQNAMLKTLEEPPPHAHLILLSSDAESVLPTVASRCQIIEFDALGEAAIEAELEGQADPLTVKAAARLARGDLGRARVLVSDRGRKLRGNVETMMAAAIDGDLADSPWMAVLNLAKDNGKQAGEKVAAVFEAEKKERIKHTKTETDQAVSREDRRVRTSVLDIALSLAASWARDLAATAAGANEVVFNVDRLEELGRQSEDVELAEARKAVGVVAETRQRFQLNVSEELALEALCFRLEKLLGPN